MSSQSVYVKLAFKYNKKVVIFLTKRFSEKFTPALSLDESHQHKENELHIARARTFYMKKNFCVDDITEMAAELKTKGYQWSNVETLVSQHGPIKLSFYFKKSIVFSDKPDPQFILDSANSISFKRCSAQLVMNSFLNGNFPNIRFFRIEECSVSDHDFQKVLLRLELLHGPKDIGKLEKKKDSFTFTDVEIQIKRCPFLSIGVFDQLRNWDNDSFLDTKKKLEGCALGLHSLKFLKSTSLLQFSACQFYKQLRKLKVKDHPIYPTSKKMLAILLTSRNFTRKTQASLMNEQRKAIKANDQSFSSNEEEVNEYDDEEEDEEGEGIVHQGMEQEQEKSFEILSNLERLSFDYSVCYNFDDLPLQSDYFTNLKSISFNGKHAPINLVADKNNANNNQPQQASSQPQQSGKSEASGNANNTDKGLVRIQFSGMLPYSLNQLQLLKLKSCELQAKFFNNFKYMDCLKNLTVLNFANSLIEMKEFSSFITSPNLKQLQSLNLRATNIDDIICSIISDFTVVSFKLIEIDVSENKLISLKGVKYLTFIDTLRCMNIRGMEQINCQLSTFIIDLMERKRSLYIKHSLKKIALKGISLEEKPLEQEIEGLEEDNQSELDDYGSGDFLKRRNTHLNEDQAKEQEGSPLADSETKKMLNNDEEQTKAESNKTIVDPKKWAILDEFCENAPQIAHIDFSGCWNVTTPLLEDLFRHRLICNLTYLNLRGTKVCNNLIDILKQSFEHEKDGIKEYWVSHKKKQFDTQNPLQYLEVNSAQFLHKNLQYFSLRECKILRSFKISLLFNLIPMESLQVIDVSSCNVFDKSVILLVEAAQERLPNLTKIRMRAIKSSPLGIQSLRKLPANKIVLIDLKQTNFDDETSLMFFSSEKNQLLKTLQFLFVKDCKQLTTTGLQAMIDGLAGMTRADIYKKRFKVSDEDFNKEEEKRKKLKDQQNQKEEEQKEAGGATDNGTNATGAGTENKAKIPKKRMIEVHPSKEKKTESIFNILKSPAQVNKREICNNFDVFGLLVDCFQLVTDRLFYKFLRKLPHVVQNISELNLNKMGRLILEDFRFEKLDQHVFKNLEILNINDTRISNNFVRKFLQFWIHANSEKKSLMNRGQEEFKMRHFMVLRCQRAHFLSSSVLDVFLNVQNIKTILSKTQFQMELLLNELGLKLMDKDLAFMKELRTAEFRFVTINIRELNIENNQFISQQGFSTILTSNWMKFILRLNVRNTQFGNTQLELISSMMKDRKQSQQFSKLQYLGIRGCIFVSKRGLQLICGMDKLSEDFDLGCICEQKMLIDAELMKDMAQSIYCKNIEYLDLSENGFNQIDKGFKYLCFKGRDVKLKLRIINVTSTWISDKALQSLAVSENLNSLEKIIMKDCKRITERGISYLVDSRHLQNLDLFFLFDSNTHLVSGRVIDTMKYSNRKASLKEISLVGSLAQDKEMNNIMQEIISESFKIKTIDIRRTSHIGLLGLSYVYSMIQWNIVKNEDSACCLIVLIIDNKRYHEFKAKCKYEKYRTELDGLKDQKDLKMKEVKLPIFEQPPKTQEYEDMKASFHPMPKQMSFEEFERRCSEIIQELQHQLLSCDRPAKMNEVFTGDFIQHLFLSAGSLKHFKYDFFLRKFALNIDEEFMDSLSLADQKWQIFIESDSTELNNNIIPGQQALFNNNFQFSQDQNNDTNTNANPSNEPQKQTKKEFPLLTNQFEYFDISGNKNLMDTPVCRFFLSTQLVRSLKIINISNTLLTSKVVLAICASPFLRDNLEFVYFSKCPKLSVKESLQYLLMCDFKQLKYKPLLAEYHYDINDEILALMLLQFKPEELRFLNLQSSKITSEGLLLLEHHTRCDEFYMLDLAHTGIKPEVLNTFMSNTPESPFPKNLRYMWLEGTYNLEDKQLDELTFWDSFNSDNFDFMEMLQSKSRRLNKSLRHLIKPRLRPFIFKKSYIQLDIFPFIPPQTLIEFLNVQLIANFDDFADLKYISLGFGKQHYPALKKAFSWWDRPDVEKYLMKYCFRIQRLANDYQGLPLLQLTARSLQSKDQDAREAVQFDFHNYLAAMSYSDILQINLFVRHSHLLKLDFEKTDMTGHLFLELCQSIKGDQNHITEVSFKGIKTIRDEQIIGMMFDEDINKIFQKISEIYEKHKTKKMAQKKAQLHEAELEIQKKIRAASKTKKFPYLVKLNVTDTKVTQYSLLQIIKLTPFNMSFRIEDLFEQYADSSYTKLDDHVINQLSTSPYLQNFQVLNLEKVPCTAATLGKIMRSSKAINISSMIINCTNISEDAFITLANSTNLPKLSSIKCTHDNTIIRKSYHYVMRAQYLSMSLKTDEGMRKQDVIDTSQFIQAIMNSFYVNNIQTLEIHTAQNFMQQIKTLFKLSRFTAFITKVGLYGVNDTEENKDVWQMVASSKSFPRLAVLSVKSLQVKEHLMILLNQKFKPAFDIESLLKDNKALIDNEVIIFISKLPLLLNSKEIDLSDLCNINGNAWKEFANSKYVVNVRRINFSSNTLLESKTEMDDKVRWYFLNPPAIPNEGGKCYNLFSRNNFFNLEKLDIGQNRGLPVKEVEWILQSIKKRHVSVKFNFEDIFEQLIEQIKPFVLMTKESEHNFYNNNNESSMISFENNNNNVEFDELDRAAVEAKAASELKNILLSDYLPGLHGLFEKYFLKTREWYSTRHKTLDLTYFQFLTKFSDLEIIFRKIQDLSCIETLKFYEGAFEQIFSTTSMKFLNLKNVKICKIYGQKQLMIDEYGSQLKNIIRQKYIKPYIFNINGFLDNYYMNHKIQKMMIEQKGYYECQNELQIYLKFIDFKGIEAIFSMNVHFAAKVITLYDAAKPRKKIPGQNSSEEEQAQIDVPIEITANDPDQPEETLQQKQELFLEYLSKSRNFSKIKKIETPLPLSLKSVKDLLESKVLHPCYDIQQHVNDLEVDSDYFTLLVNSRFYRNVNKLVFPKLKAGEKQDFDPEKLEINRISKLLAIKIIEPIESAQILKQIFSLDNVKFNKKLTADKFEFKKLESEQFEAAFKEVAFGLDWTVLLNLLERNKQLIEGSVYEQLIFNKSAYFFLTSIIIPATLDAARAREVIKSINDALLKLNSSIKNSVQEGERRDSKAKQDKEKSKEVQLLATKLSLMQFPSDSENQNQIFTFLSNLTHLKEIEFSDKITFGLQEAKILILNTSSTHLSETVLSWVIPKLSKPELEELWTFLSADDEIPKNLSYISFSNSQHLMSKEALAQKISDLKINKKTKKDNNKEDDGEIQDNDAGERNEEKENDDNDNEKQEKLREEDNQKGNENDNADNGNAEGENDQNDEENEENELNNADNENVNQDLDSKEIQKIIDDLNKNTITEEDLLTFLDHFEGLRELDFSKTLVDKDHLKVIRKLKVSKILHFVNFQDCSRFPGCIPFIWLISDDLKPWFQLNKYLTHLPLKLSKMQDQKHLMKAIMRCMFFKRNFKFFDVDFALKDNQQPKQNLLEMFEYLIRERVSCIDITAFMQGLPAYMKNFVNDDHIEQICKIYGNVMYLQPEIFPMVQYGFNHILQQKNIPTAIRLMYLLNEPFQKKISASSLSIVYQLALESDDLKKNQVVAESDSQLKKMLERLKLRIRARRRNLKNKKKITLKQIENENDVKNLKVLGVIGKKKISKQKTNASNTNGAQSEKSLENKLVAAIVKKKTVEENTKGQDDDDVDLDELVQKTDKKEAGDLQAHEDEFAMNEKDEEELAAADDAAAEAAAALKEKDADNEEQNNQEDEDEDDDDEEEENNEENGKPKLKNKDSILKAADLLEEEMNNVEELEDGKDNEDVKNNEQADEEDVHADDQDNQNEDEEDKNDQSEIFQGDTIQLNGNDQKDKDSIRYSFAGENENSFNDISNEVSPGASPKTAVINSNRKRKVSMFANAQQKKGTEKNKEKTHAKEKTFLLNEENSKTLTPSKPPKSKAQKFKYDFKGEITTQKQSVKNNMVRVYASQTALKLHKQLIHLHNLSENLKEKNQRNLLIEQKLAETDKQLDVIDFELQILEYRRRNFSAQEVDNLFSFMEVLNLGENNHLNMYGLNFYVAEHILPWIKMNQNLNELKDGQKRGRKIMSNLNHAALTNKNNNNQQMEDDDEALTMAGVLSPDHALDDKLIEHLSYLIDRRLKQLREMDLRGLNVSDDFAEKFSLILGDDHKLKHLSLLDLSNNRRLSPFGLKFLFSSIVNRIPQGFKIILSSTNNDAEHLRLQIELLEKSILKEAVWILDKQKKQIEKYIRQNKSKLSQAPPSQKQPQRKNSILDYDPEIAGAQLPKIEKLEFVDINMPDFSEDGDIVVTKKIEAPKSIIFNDFESVDEEEERRKKLLNGELQFFFSREKSLDERIVRKLEKNSDFKNKIERLRCFQLAYRKAIQESGYQSIGHQTDIRMIVQNVVNLGLYSAINIVIRDNWKRHKYFIITVAILVAPFTFFHLLMMATYRLTLFLQRNQIQLRCKFGSNKKTDVIIELDKLVPDNIQNTDFFFDEDVAQVDLLLSRNKKKKIPTELQRRNGRLICEYINKPENFVFQQVLQKINDSSNKEINPLNYFDFLIIFNFFVFTLLLCVGYTYYIIFFYIPNNYPEHSCKSIPVWFDVPFFLIGLFIIAFEGALLQNIEKVIVSQKIFSFKSLFVVFQLYNSFMQRYNLYTDMIFAFNIYYCDKAPDLGLISICILAAHLFFQSSSMIFAFIQVQVAKRVMDSQPIHNTAFINLYTKIALIQDFSGLSSVLDRFSTSSTITLAGPFIPKQLLNVKIPQILLTKFQKVFLEDVPQVIIVLIYNLRFSKSNNLLEWENLRVLLTTVLSMYNSLNSAWQAHPSVFRTYQMQDYLKFRQNTSEIYKIKIEGSNGENKIHMSIPKVISKVFSFNQKFQLKKETIEDKLRQKQKSKPKKKEKKIDKDGQSSRGQNSSPGSVVSGNGGGESKSQINVSEKEIGQSQTSIKSRASNGALVQSSARTDKSVKQLFPKQFKQKLIDFLLEQEKSNLQPQ